MNNKEVIVIGGNHHNMLGAIREFGKFNIQVYAIITNSSKYAYVKKSKYVKESIIVEESENEILKALNYFQKRINKKKIVLIPTSDFAEYVIDKNLNKLEENFLIPNINGKPNEIIKYMNKFEQVKLCSKYDIKMAKSWIEYLGTNEDIEKSKLFFPCLMKPLESIDGEKADICISHNLNEYRKNLENFKKKKYKKILVQEYINYNYEISIMGCSFEKDVIISGAIKKIRRYPDRTGNVSFGIVEPLNNEKIKSKIYNLFKEINYNGLFDIDIFNIGENKWMINEINFRNSGNTYSLSYDNVYLVVLYYYMISGLSIDKLKKEVTKEYYMRDVYNEKLKLRKHEINLKEYLSDKQKTQTDLTTDKEDNNVKIWKMIYAILRRINKNGEKRF